MNEIILLRHAKSTWDQESRRQFPEWNRIAAANWKPAEAIPSGIRLGEYRVRMDPAASDLTPEQRPEYEYDGLGMRVWRHQPGDPQGLPGNNVQALMVGSDDRVWVATEGGGISVLDAQRQAFTHYRKATRPELGSDDIWSFASQGDAVWFGTYDGGLHRMDLKGRIRRYTMAQDGLPSDTVLALAVDAGGVLWIGTDAGLAPAAKSLDALAAVKVDIVCPAYGPPIVTDVSASLRRTADALREAGFNALELAILE